MRYQCDFDTVDSWVIFCYMQQFIQLCRCTRLACVVCVQCSFVRIILEKSLNFYAVSALAQTEDSVEVAVSSSFVHGRFVSGTSWFPITLLLSAII